MAYVLTNSDALHAWLRLTRSERHDELKRLSVPETTVKEWEHLHGLCCTADRTDRYTGPYAYEVSVACRDLLIADPKCMRALASSVATRDRLGETRLCNCGRALFIDCADRACSSAQMATAELFAKALLSSATGESDH